MKKDLYYYRLGRAYLMERNWQEAQDCFLKAFHEDNPVSIKAKAVLGIIFSHCKIDMETVAHLHDKLTKESENLDECI